MASPTKKEKKFYKIDPIVISEDAVLDFDVFYPITQNKLEVAHPKGTPITKEALDTLNSYEFLYVNDTDNQAYRTLYEELIKAQGAMNKELELYKSMTKSINSIFENPESLGNVKEAKEVVGGMLETIMDDEFAVNSLISILSYDYYTHTHSLNASVYALCL